MSCVPIIDLSGQLITGPLSESAVYQVPNAATAIVEDLINATWCEGQETKAEFEAKMATALSGFLDIIAAPHVTAGNVSALSIVEPVVDIPAALSAEQIYSEWTDKYMELADELVTRFNAFRASYLPNETAAFNEISARLSELAALTVADVTAGTVSAGTVSATSVGASGVSGTSVSAGTSSSGTVIAPAVAEPNVYIPEVVDTSAILTMFETIYLEIIALLEAKFTSYRGAWFADEPLVYSTAEDWLLAALANAEISLPPSIADQIWGDDRDRITADAMRAQEDILGTFAARRFPLPPGAATKAVIDVQRTAQEAIAASSRKVAITSVELQQKLIEHALQLRVTSMAAANDYIKALGSGPDIASRLVGIGYDAQSKLINAVAALLNARSDVAKLSLSASTVTVQTAFEASKTNILAALDAARANQSTDLSAQTTGAQLALEAAKITASLSLDAGKANASNSLEASKTNVTIAFEAAKANQLAKLEQVKTALGQSVQLRGVALNASIDYVKTFATTATASAQVVGTVYDSKNRLITAAAAFFGARTNAGEAMSKVSQYNNSITFESAAKNQASDLQMIENKLKAMLTEAQAIAQMTTSLFNNLHVGANVNSNGGTTLSQTGEY